MYAQQGQPAVRRMQGVLSFVKKYGIARVDEACATALELEVYNYRFVRRLLEHHAQPPGGSDLHETGGQGWYHAHHR